MFFQLLLPNAGMSAKSSMLFSAHGMEPERLRKSSMLISTHGVETTVDQPRSWKHFLHVIVFTEPQATLVKLFCVFLYYVLGVLAYNQLEHGSWSLTQTIYFITVTFVSYGGDGYCHATNDASKVFTMLYIILGFILVFSLFTEVVKTWLVGAQRGCLRTLLNVLGIKKISTTTMRIYQWHSSWFAIGLLILIGTLFLSANEECSICHAAYWTVCIMSTVGFGDIHIQYESTRVFVIIFCLCCVLTYATAAANIFEVHGAQLQSMSTTTVLTVLSDDPKSCADAAGLEMDDEDDRDEDRAMTVVALARVTFVLKRLERLGLVDHEKDIEPLIALFNERQHLVTDADSANSATDIEGGSSDSIYGLPSPQSSSASTTMTPTSLLRDHSITAISNSAVSNPMHHPPEPGQGPRLTLAAATTTTTTITTISVISPTTTSTMV